MSTVAWHYALVGSYGDVRSGTADLRAAFGDLSDADARELLDALVDVDGLLDSLAVTASAHVGVAYRNVGLGSFPGNLAGGPSGMAGDLWFEVDLDSESDGGELPWLVTARIVVFCDLELSGQTRGYSCTHDLLSIERRAADPREAISLLAPCIAAVEREVLKRRPEEFAGRPHSELAGG